MARKTSAAFAERFMVEPGKPFALAKVDRRDDSAFGDKDEAKAQTEENAEAIRRLRSGCSRKAALVLVWCRLNAGQDARARGHTWGHRVR